MGLPHSYLLFLPWGVSSTRQPRVNPFRKWVTGRTGFTTGANPWGHAPTLPVTPSPAPNHNAAAGWGGGGKGIPHTLHQGETLCLLPGGGVGCDMLGCQGETGSGSAPVLA